MMIATSLIFIILQVPALQYTGTKDQDAQADHAAVAKAERPFAFVAFLVSMAAFVAYLFWNGKRASVIADDVIEEVRICGHPQRRDLTFRIGIFATLLFFKGGLVWGFTAETVTILFVELAMGYFAMKKTMRLKDAVIVLLLYPFSIFLVAFLENTIGLD